MYYSATRNIVCVLFNGVHKTSGESMQNGAHGKV